MLLLETKRRSRGRDANMCNLPIETLPEMFALLHEATHRGITVIEAAGNGCDAIVPETGIDLDDYADESGVRILRRNSPRGDSGAIIVGAARAEVQDGKHRRIASSNYGSRVDCYAWGEVSRRPLLPVMHRTLRQRARKTLVKLRLPPLLLPALH